MRRFAMVEMYALSAQLVGSSATLHSSSPAGVDDGSKTLRHSEPSRKGLVLLLATAR
jgi:hypothetical protein